MTAVQRRLIKKTEEAVAKDSKLHELERINGELKKQLVRLPGPDIGERLNRSRDAIKARSRQIKVSFIQHCYIVRVVTNNSQNYFSFLLGDAIITDRLYDTTTLSHKWPILSLPTHLPNCHVTNFYCAMHVVQSAVLLSSVVRPSVCLSVCNVEVPWA